MTILRIENKSTGDKIISAFGIIPILKMIEDNPKEARNWLVVVYPNKDTIIPLDSWKAIDFYRVNAIKSLTCPDCFDGIQIDGAIDSYGADAFESTCTTCNGSGKITA